LAGGGRAEALVDPAAGERAEPRQKPTPLWVLKATQLLGAAAFACFSRYVNVYFSEIGLSRTQIGVLGFVSPFASFAGQIFWGAVIDRLGEYKRTLVATQLLGTAAIMLFMLSPVKQSFAAVMMVTVLWTFMLSTGGPIMDAMCLTVLAEQNVTDEAYGDQRLWCAVGWGGMALIAGQLIDTFGLDFMFLGFAVIQLVDIGICVVWLPKPKKPDRDSAAAAAVTEPAEPPRNLWTFEVIWFFANLMQYGAAMSLIEGFLFVWLVEDFHGTTKLLLGAATVVMCLFEIPIFKYMGRLWRGGVGFDAVIMFCQAILVLRLLLYTLLPESTPWLVLFVEPLHGICFAAMWAASVEYGQRLAPPNAVARMQALVNGLYYQVSMGLGSMVWGVLVEPTSLGFVWSFWVDAMFIVAWAVIWRLGLYIHRRRRRGQEQSCRPRGGQEQREVPLAGGTPLADGECGAVGAR